MQALESLLFLTVPLLVPLAGTKLRRSAAKQRDGFRKRAQNKEITTFVLRNSVWIVAFLLDLTFRLSAQTPYPAANTAIRSMWDKNTFDSVVNATKSVNAAKKPSRPEAATTSASSAQGTSTQQIDRTPKWPRQRTAAFSADCPPDWIADPKAAIANSLWFHTKKSRKLASGDDWYDYSVAMAYFPDQKTIIDHPDVEGYIQIWAKSNGYQLPPQIDISELPTIFGPALRAGVSHGTEFNYDEENEFLFVKRPKGWFLIRVDNPINDNKLQEIIEHLFSSLSFQDKTRAEEAREFIRR